MQPSAFELDWAAVIARALLPADLLGGATADVDIQGGLARDCAETPWYTGLLFRLTVWAIWISPLFVVGRLRTFGGLDEELRERHLERLAAARIYEVRMLVYLFKLTLCTVVLGVPAVYSRLDAYGLGEEPAALVKLDGRRAP